MTFTEDLRYVSAKEQLVARLHGASYTDLLDIRHSLLGRWLVGRPGVMKVNEVLLAHGGVAPGSSPRSVEAVNDSMWMFMSEDLFYHWADTTLAPVTDSATGEQLADQYERVIVMDPAAVTRRAELIFNETASSGSEVMWNQTR